MTDTTITILLALCMLATIVFSIVCLIGWNRAERKADFMVREVGRLKEEVEQLRDYDDADWWKEQ